MIKLSNAYFHDLKLVLVVAYSVILSFLAVTVIFKIDPFLCLIISGIIALSVSYFTHRIWVLILNLALTLSFFTILFILDDVVFIKNYETIILLVFFFIVMGLLIVEHNLIKREETLEGQSFSEEFSKLETDFSKKNSYYAERSIALKRYLNLEKLAIKMNKCIKEENILDIAANDIYKLIKKGTCYIFFKKTNEFKLFAGKPKSFRQKINSKEIDFSSGIFEYMTTRKEALKIDNLSKEFRFKEISAIKGTNSLICVPILVEGDVIGFIKLDSKKTEDYNYDDLRILSIASELAGLSLTNAFYLNKITALAISDPLTGLFVRRYFIEQLMLGIEFAEKSNSHLSLIFIDIDHFKKFNDSYGHLLGDKILSILGKFFLDSTRENDLIGRYGGEEFAIIMKDTGIDLAYKISERLRESVSDLKLEYEGAEYSITISLGVAEYFNKNFTSEQLIEAADIALYSAKKQGRNKTITFDGNL